MLKYEGQWEGLTEQEKLVLLAVAIKIRDTDGITVGQDEVKRLSGLSEEDFWRAQESLEAQGFIEAHSSSTSAVSWFKPAGDSLTWDMLGPKYHSQEHRKMLGMII